MATSGEKAWPPLGSDASPAPARSDARLRCQERAENSSPRSRAARKNASPTSLPASVWAWSGPEAWRGSRSLRRSSTRSGVVSPSSAPCSVPGVKRARAHAGEADESLCFKLGKDPLHPTNGGIRNVDEAARWREADADRCFPAPHPRRSEPRRRSLRSRTTLRLAHGHVPSSRRCGRWRVGRLPDSHAGFRARA